MLTKAKRMNTVRNILSHLYARRKWCRITALLIVEMVVFACLHAAPTDDYSAYVAQTSGQYRTLLGFIFWENLQSALFLLLCGTVPFGLGTVFGAYAAISGLVSAAKTVLPQVGGRTLLLCTLPHGLFELATICFSILLSVLWSRAVTVAIIDLCRGKPVWPQFWKECKFLLRSFLLILLPLVMIAAVMEVTVSAPITDLLLKGG